MSGDASIWAVPAGLRETMTTPAQRAWLAALPQTAAGLAERWSLRPVGPPWSGWWSAVWPVLDAADEPRALKVSTPGDGREHEVAALRAFAGRGAVRLFDDDPGHGALLLERLDGGRTLESHPDIDEASAVVADLLAELGGRPAPAGLRPLADVAAATLADVERDAPAGALPARAVDAARETLAALAAVPAAAQTLVHGDLHFLNVLPALPGHPPRWAAIDPLPFAGLPELEPVAMLRNRFADAAATGDPDRALRRRVDVLADRTGMDAGLARRVAQAVAVQNLPYLLAEHPDHAFVAPYTLLSRW